MTDDATVRRVLIDLLTIAKVAMPAGLYAIDPRVLKARDLLTELATSSRPPSIGREPPVPHLGNVDPDDPWARHVLALLDAEPEPQWDIAEAIQQFMLEPEAPATRSAAVALILREWLTANGYLELLPAREDGH